MGKASAWLGEVPPARWERHYGDRLVRCFAHRPRSTYELLAQAAARRPNGEALVCAGQRLDYAAFGVEVARCAAGLRETGVGRGDRVALALGNSAIFPVLFFAVQRLGAIAVPIGVRERADGIAYILCHSQARLLVHDTTLADRLPPPEATPTVIARRAIDPAAKLTDLPLAAAATDDAPPAAVDEDATAMILYTSGTTGRPKGAMLTHLGLCHSAMHYELAMRLTSADRTIAAVPFTHVTGLVGLILAMVRAAATLVVLPEFKAPAFLDLAAGERMTHSLMVPAMYELCLRMPGFDLKRLASWRIGGYGGAAMAPATIARFAEMLPGLDLMNVYGATETTSPATMMPPAETAARPDSVGRPLPCGEVLVMDEQGREVAPGEAGELWLGGPMVVPGYWSDPDATRENFSGGFWRSGDIGSKDAEGFVYLLDRKKDYDQSRRLQGLFRRGRERPDGTPRRRRGRRCGGALPGAWRAGACRRRL
jgi:long-chain acyl-CoA synthetase